MKAVNTVSKAKPKLKARKSKMKAAAAALRNSLPDEELMPLADNLDTETEEQREKRRAKLKAKTLKVFQMAYDTHQARLREALTND